VPGRHARAQQGLDLVGRERLGRERLEQGADGPDVGREVVGGGVGDVVKEVQADQGAECRIAQLGDRVGEVDGADPVLALGPQVVADDEAPVRPADQHRPVQAQLVDDRRPSPVVAVDVGCSSAGASGPDM
jgi:hypothetical protein